jgi:hypothetical protein
LQNVAARRKFMAKIFGLMLLASMLTACVLEDEEGLEEDISSDSSELRASEYGDWGPCHGWSGPGVTFLSSDGNFYCATGSAYERCTDAVWCNGW